MDNKQGGATRAVVVVLVEAVAMIPMDVVHGDGDLAPVDHQVADEVHWLVGARVCLQLEVVKGDGEGQRECRAVIRKKMGGGLPGGQRHTAMQACPGGESPSRQNQHNGGEDETIGY